MEQNVGEADKLVRIGLGAVLGIAALAVLGGSLQLPAVASPILGVISLVLLGTAVTGTCGLYAVLGVDTCSRSGESI
jgi:amino acid transporter